MLEITLEPIFEYHEEPTGGPYYYYPAIRVNIDNPSKKQMGIVHRCEDIPGTYFESKGEAVTYATKWLESHPKEIGKVIINRIKE